jgi:peptide chain release factor 2
VPWCGGLTAPAATGFSRPASRGSRQRVAGSLPDKPASKLATLTTLPLCPTHVHCSKISVPGSTTPGGSFDVDQKAADLEELRKQASAPDLWSDPDEARKVTRVLARYEKTIAHVEAIGAALDDADVLLELGEAEQDQASVKEATAELEGLETELADLERESLFFGEYDDNPAIVSIHAGAGEVDAQDWAEMLLRMYRRYLDTAGFDVEIDDVQEGEEAGIKSASLTVRGDFAYGTMEGERGVHRLVRMSPFDAANRRHTSFAAVDVIPEVEAAPFEISSDDLRIDVMRAQGAGGQHVNTTDSAVRITHLPTNIVVTCQAERSQLQNRARAMELLNSRLAELARQQHADRLEEIRGEQNEAAWGHQIRSYVLAPYQMVKDLRTDVEKGNVEGVLDGDIADFADAYLEWRRRQESEAQDG